MIVAGIDPGTGSSSPTGFVVFNSDTLTVIKALNISPSKKKDEVYKRIRDIKRDIAHEFDNYNPELCCIEDFVMRGKGGETLQQLIGAFMSEVPQELEFVQNTVVKKIISGRGDADKLEVAQGLLCAVKANKETRALVERWIDDQEWDLIDAFAIGISGYQQYMANR